MLPLPNFFKGNLYEKANVYYFSKYLVNHKYGLFVHNLFLKFYLIKQCHV
jgi:hypothetical protein